MLRMPLRKKAPRYLGHNPESIVHHENLVKARWNGYKKAQK
ncbi:hypothetical protein CRENPOLYSF1_1130006 [Crenothrix polyspora]|uniref:Uncharacterized protein n=1 Tax=Crenothrix polyspora TaxID=360316 RepID=A0A1R4GZW5_9GAMM|nr:hypothetical protein CRENPOLYSF1_1130006 [Crenothrix polyspora]